MTDLIFDKARIKRSLSQLKLIRAITPASTMSTSGKDNVAKEFRCIRIVGAGSMDSQILIAFSE
jgi:hypothetical protein